MKSRTILLSLIALTGLLAGLVVAQSRSTPAFDQLKTLVGEWEGKTENGKTVHASYKLVSSGTALLETLNPPDEAEMVTLYHPDGSRLALTHYCSSNNQPHMRTEPITGPTNQFNFAFAGASNLPSPSTGHMHQLQLTIGDKDHFTQKWTWLEKGSEHQEVFRFTRTK